MLLSLCQSPVLIWGENIHHIQTVTQEVDFDDKCDTVARICPGSGTGSVCKSNLSSCGARSQWLTSLLFSDSPQTEQACRKLIRYIQNQASALRHRAAIRLSIIIFKAQGRNVPPLSIFSYLNMVLSARY